MRVSFILFLLILPLTGQSTHIKKSQLSVKSNENIISVDALISKASLGEAETQFKLGIRYEMGDGVPQDFTEASKWYRKAADQAHAKAQFYLGKSYEKGNGVPLNDEEALKWYKKAANQGYADAQFYLGIRYQQGEGVPKNEGEAMKWYELAAQQGYKSAVINLAFAYQENEGKDPLGPVMAARWFRKAADSEDPGAMEIIGTYYHRGYGVPQDYSEAMKWWRKSAMTGYSQAQFKLGSVFKVGAK